MSFGTCPVVRIVSDNPAHIHGFIEINESDFDNETMTLFKGDVEVAPPPSEKIAEPVTMPSAPLAPTPGIAQVVPPSGDGPPSQGGWGDVKPA